jgi:hypothetical protein
MKMYIRTILAAAVIALGGGVIVKVAFHLNY